VRKSLQGREEERKKKKRKERTQRREGNVSFEELH
jgi:hypothetical protein